MQSDELGKVLRLLGLKKKRLVSLLPLLEFITWSLLKEDGMVSETCGNTSRTFTPVFHWEDEPLAARAVIKTRNIFVLFQLMMPKVWLLAKQRTWKAGIPRYIPNSGVWVRVSRGPSGPHVKKK